MRKPVAAVLLVGAVVAAGLVVAQAGADSDGTAAACVVGADSTVCTVPHHYIDVPGPTETVVATVTAEPEPAPTVTVTTTATATATAEPTPSSTPTPTPTPSPTPTEEPAGWPDATTTGPTGTLGTYSGPMTITKAGSVVENVRVNGQLTIRAANVTIRNVALTTGAYYGVLTYSPRTTIVDTRIVGGGTASVAAYEAGTVDLLRVDVSGGEDGVRLASDSSLVDSYVHDLAGDSSSHFDAVTADGYRRWRIEHNTILNSHSQTAAVWIGDPRYSPSEGVLTRNLLAGGGYTLYAGPGAGEGLRVTDNVFSRRFFPKVGYWGPVTSWSSAGNVWSGNVDDSGNTVQP